MATALETIFDDNHADWVPSTTDLDAWEEIEAAGADTTATKVGLFGGDLTAFLDDCAAAEEGDCDVADYDGLNGWAFGVEWTPAAARLRQATADACNFVVFTDRLIGAAVIWNDETELESFTVDLAEADIADTIDPTADITVLGDSESFEGFWGDVTDLDGPQYAVHFQEEGADIYYEVDSESTVWAYLGFGDGVSTDVTWAGAAQLTAAAGAVAVALLF